jgi:cation transport ATPase
MGEAARMGVLIRKAESLERARNVLLMLSVPL